MKSANKEVQMTFGDTHKKKQLFLALSGDGFQSKNKFIRGEKLPFLGKGLYVMCSSFLIYNFI